MSNYSFVEDAYIDFSQLILVNTSLADPTDIATVNNFYIKLSNNDPLTAAQAKYIIRLLSKYQSIVKKLGLEYDHIIKNPRWKQEFRVLDLTKKVYVSNIYENKLSVCLKFPYTFKSTFENEFLQMFYNVPYKWDRDLKVNVIKLYDVNLISLHEFCQKHNFEIEDSFLSAVSKIEEIWENQLEIIPHSFIDNGKIFLKNVSEDTQNYWDEHVTNDYFKDLFLSKIMGLELKIDSAKHPIEIMASTDTTNFWVNNFEKFFDIYKKLEEKVAIILDSSEGTFQWLEEFISEADKSDIDRSHIKICFREERNENQKFNDWVKINGLGGKIESGKIFIFRSKPAKWLYSKTDINMVVTNGLFPSANITTQRYILSKPCVIYLGSIKASHTKDKKIAQL